MITVRKIYSSKAGNLRLLADNGFPVPPFVVINRAGSEEILAPIKTKLNDLLARGHEDDRYFIDLSGQIKDLIISMKIRDSLIESIKETCSAHFGQGYRIAVRSSALFEDTASSSFAGQLETFLNVTSETLEERIKHCLYSAYSPNAMRYRSMRGYDPKAGQMEIILQTMVEAQYSGVLFTMNPNGNLNETAIIAGQGPGDGVVDGQVDTDHYFIDRSENAIRMQTIGDNPLIKIDTLLELFDYGQQAESLFQTAQDLEFTIDPESKIWILQSRPVTGIQLDDLKILDNSNIVESYPGITLPLSFTFARNAYEKVFTATMKAFGVPEKITKENKRVLENLLAYHNGRVYYRLDNWYRMVSHAFSAEKQLREWEKNLGIPKSEAGQLKIGFRRNVRSIATLLRLLLTYPSKNRKFYSSFWRNYEDLVGLPRDEWSNKAYFAFYRLKGDLLFKTWATTQINDFIAFRSFSAMQNLLGKIGFGKESGIANDLMCGIPSVESELTMLELLKLKQMIIDDAGLFHLFKNNAPEKVLEHLLEQPYNDFKRSFDQYIASYGDRTLEELKLETPSLKQDPVILVIRLQQQLDTMYTVSKIRATQKEIRSGAQEKLNRRIKWYHPVRWYLGVLIEISRYGLKNRENMRLARARSYGVVKAIFLTLAKRMTKDRVIEAQKDIFYLDEADVERYCMEGDMASLAKKVTHRKDEIERFRKIDMPNRIIYTGDELPYLNTRMVEYLQPGKMFKGTPVSKGVVQAEVVMLDMPDHSVEVKDKIMITRMTDPGWLFLMSRAKGLISEKGSLLSHTAIVGRELGLPTIVGVQHATRIFRDGQIVFMDGATGYIEIINEVI